MLGYRKVLFCLLATRSEKTLWPYIKHKKELHFVKSSSFLFYVLTNIIFELILIIG
jgi:hypothetical protein